MRRSLTVLAPIALVAAAVVAALILGVALLPALLTSLPFGGTVTETCRTTAGDTAEELRAVPAAWVDPVREAAASAGVPAAVLAAQLEAESGWDPQAVSARGAVGLGQFMPETWAQYGVGDPTDPVAAITATGAYMADLMEAAAPHSTGTAHQVELALAAYNAGPGTMERIGWVIAAAPAETTNYVATILEATQTGHTADCAAALDLEVGDLGDGDWAPPLPGGTLTSGYGARALASGPSWANDHVGVDIASDPTLGRYGPGRPVVAVAPMTITRASCTTDPSMGCNVVGRLTEGDGLLIGYYHLDRTTVTAGQRLERGDPVGIEGNKGAWVFPTHLHLELYHHTAGDDPYPYAGHNLDPTPILRQKGAL